MSVRRTNHSISAKQNIYDIVEDLGNILQYNNHKRNMVSKCLCTWVKSEIDQASNSQIASLRIQMAWHQVFVFEKIPKPLEMKKDPSNYECGSYNLAIWTYLQRILIPFPWKTHSLQVARHLPVNDIFSYWYIYYLIIWLYTLLDK